MRLNLIMARRMGRVRCDRGGCGTEFEVGLETFLGEHHFCNMCRRLLASVPLRDEKAFRRTEAEQRELWEKLRCFNMTTTGAPWLDNELVRKFGPWTRSRIEGLWDAE